MSAHTGPAAYRRGGKGKIGKRHVLMTAKTSMGNGGDGTADRLRGRRRNSTRWSRRSKLLFVGLVFCVTATIVTALYFGTQIKVLRSDNERLGATLEARERELATLRPEVEQLRVDVDALVQKRVPGLRPLTFDQVISLDERYLRTVVFSVVKRGGKSRYEYRLTMRNDSVLAITPRLSIALFDRHGVHIGVARIGVMAEASDLMPDLQPGESVSKSGFISMVSDTEEEPAYFLVRVAEPVIKPEPLPLPADGSG